MNGRPRDTGSRLPSSAGETAAAGADRTVGPDRRPDAFMTSQPAMNGETFQRNVVITNPEGFHLRPMAAFAETALRFQSQVTVTKNGLTADGKSPLLLMGLAAEQGDRLVLEASGPDAPAALNALIELLTTLAVASEVPSSPQAS